MTAPSLVERVAQKMEDEAEYKPVRGNSILDEVANWPDVARAAISAVLEAMETPSREMLEAAADAPDDDDWLSAMAKAYCAMLTAFRQENGLEHQ